jgi:peptide/nickel transport system substrate-binding protein
MRKGYLRLITVISIFLVVGLMSQSLLAAERPLRTSWSWPTYIDPSVGSDNSSSTALINLYDTLVYPDKDGNPTPHVAVSWKSENNGKRWVFNLRKGIKFHDGAELTAKDVKFSMDRLQTIGEGYAFLFTGKGLSTEVVDRYTVAFNFERAFGPFITTLYRFFILNEKLVMTNIKTPGPYKKKGDYGKKFLLINDAGSGPYKVKKFKFEEYLNMEVNSDYFLPIDPQAPDEYKMIGTTQAVTVRSMMSRRELEISDQWQALESLQALDKIEGIDIAELYMGDVFYFMMHTKKAPTDDIHFRRAMAWALDYEIVYKMLFPGSKQSRGPVAQTTAGFNPNTFQFKKDLAKAKAELKKSKYYSQLDQYPVEIHWIAEVPDEEKVALLFMSNMAEIGIDVKVVKVPWMSVVEETANIETSPNIVTIFDNPQYPEAGAILEARYKSSTANTWEQNEWLMDKQYDALIADALGTVDRQERYKKYHELQDYIVELCPTLFLFDKASKHAYQQSYVDWPATRGEMPSISGFSHAARFIKILK